MTLFCNQREDELFMIMTKTLTTNQNYVIKSISMELVKHHFLTSKYYGQNLRRYYKQEIIKKELSKCSKKKKN